MQVEHRETHRPRDLADVGMPARRIRELLAGFRTALESVDQERPAPASAAPAAPAPAVVEAAAQLLDLLMITGSWFRVYDPSRSESRWLKVIARHAEPGPEPGDQVVFAEFNGRNSLALPTARFLDDLAAGRTEPFDQSPAAKHALKAFMERRRAATSA